MSNQTTEANEDGQSPALAVAPCSASDTARLDWLERTLVSLHRIGPYMGGECVGGQLENKARDDKGLGGPSYFRVSHRSIRAAIDEAMAWPNSD